MLEFGRTSMRNAAIVLFLCLTVFCNILHAADEGRSSQPINIKSNELVADSKGRTATFIGKVIARQQDITIYADKLVVYYSEQGGDVDKVEAFGSVRIVQQNRVGTAGHAVYINKEGKISLSDNPKVYQGKNVVTGQVITYFISEEKSVVTGGPNSRVNAVIYPKGKGKDGERGP
jgi:lipopolysaccharide export system protein LptA